MNAILSAIAKGASRNNEIATKVDMTTGALNNYLKSLIDLQIIEKIHPVRSKSNKKYLYHQRFYVYLLVSFCRTNQGAIGNFNGQTLYNRQIR